MRLSFAKLRMPFWHSTAATCEPVRHLLHIGDVQIHAAHHMRSARMPITPAFLACPMRRIKAGLARHTRCSNVHRVGLRRSVSVLHHRRRVAHQLPAG